MAAHLPGLGGPIRNVCSRGTGPQSGGQFRLCLTKMRPVHHLVNKKERAMFTFVITVERAQPKRSEERGGLTW